MEAENQLLIPLVRYRQQRQGKNAAKKMKCNVDFCLGTEVSIQAYLLLYT